MNKVMKVFSTKYALTAGIEEIDGYISETSDEMLCETRGDGGYPRYFHGEEVQWHRSRVSAVGRAEYMRVKKIASLKRQITRIERLSFK